MRELLILRNSSGTTPVFARLEHIRMQQGRDARDALMRDYASQWRLGNRGDPGVWL